LCDMEEKIKRMDRLAALGELAAGLAHEIRNPLTSLSGSIQVLRDELDLTEENRKLMDIALGETKRLNNLITDFLLFAQPERGEKKKLDISSLIEETLDLFIHSPECEKNIRVTKSIAPELLIEGNAGHLKQVFWNILKNAVQSQPVGGDIHVTAMIENQETTLEEDVPNRKTKISIKDNGCGIPQEIQKKIFDPFFTTKEQGSGLGLAISYRIIENHKGELTISSNENKGTEVVIYLPLLFEKF
jgi:signal transduction histidine kinase